MGPSGGVVTGNRRVLKRLRHSGRALLATLLVGAGMSASIAPAGASHGIFAPAVNYGTGTFPQSVTAGDLDGDTDLDLAVANFNSDNVSVLVGAGDGAFATAVNYGTGDSPQSVTAGDLDGDGILDLAVANAGSDNVSVLVGAGNGTFATAVNHSAGDAPVSVTTGDLDGDGILDLAVANQFSDNVSVLLGEGEGYFESAVSYGAGDAPTSVTTGDFDADADLDLAVGNFGGNVLVLLGAGNGTFATAVNYGAGSKPWSVTAGDLDGDGDLDLAVANEGSDNVSVLLGAGNGTFAAAVNYGAGDGPHSVTAGDLDGDGDLDLAVANLFSDNVSVLLGAGNGTFAAAVNYGAGDGPRSITAGDLDGDGDLSLAVANGIWDNVSVLLNNVAPVLAPVGNKTVGENQNLSFTVAATDTDGDPLTYAASNLPAGATFDSTTRTFDWTPSFTQEGTYSGVEFTVNDGHSSSGSDSEAITITITHTNAPPVLDPIGNKTVAEGQTLSFTVAASDVDGELLTFGATNLPPGATFTQATRRFTWTPSFTQAGTHTDIEFWATDGIATDSEIFSITVTNAQMASSTTLGISKTATKVKAVGTVAPSHPGLPMVVKLFKKISGTWRRLATKRPLLNSASAYSTSFARPSPGDCKVTAKFPGDEDHSASSARKTFNC
jgi:hypothetical protein